MRTKGIVGARNVLMYAAFWLNLSVLDITRFATKRNYGYNPFCHKSQTSTLFILEIICDTFQMSVYS